MPRSWYDTHVQILKGDNSDKANMLRELYMNIAADKKPYFMRYIYPTLMSDYTTYIKKTDQKCLMEFNMTVSELKRKPVDELTDDQKSFLKYYNERLPVSDGDCVMNRICRRVEEFVEKGVKSRLSECSFDYSFMKSGHEYTDSQYYAIVKLYNEHKEIVQSYKREASNKRSAERGVTESQRQSLARLFRSRCFAVCSNEETLCDIILDVCYKREGTKQFAWDVCGRAIFANLFRNSGGVVEYPRRDPDGDIEYAGEKFSLAWKESDQWLTSL